jgi:hypothetical protein
MDGQVERYLAQLTSACLEACINLGADTKTTLKLVRRASTFLYDLVALYDACEQNRLDELLQSWRQRKPQSQSRTQPTHPSAERPYSLHRERGRCFCPRPGRQTGSTRSSDARPDGA